MQASDTIAIDGAGSSTAQSEQSSAELPIVPSDTKVQTQMNIQSSSEAAQVGSSHLGESSASVQLDNVPKADHLASGSPKTFWHLSASELFAYILDKNASLRGDLTGEPFTEFDWSTQNVLAQLTTELIPDFFDTIGLGDHISKFKIGMFETFLINQIVGDTNIPESIRSYWTAYRFSRHAVLPASPKLSSVTPHSQVNDGISRQLNFGPSTPGQKSQMMTLPGVASPMKTPSFYKHIDGQTSSLFHMLESPVQQLHSSIQNVNGLPSFQINMLPAVPVIHHFPSMDTFSKLEVSPFLFKYKIAKLSAPAGTKKSIKSCINPLLWSDMAN
jgi:hypothetical protein